jgi:hypothetical protein
MYYSYYIILIALLFLCPNVLGQLVSSEGEKGIQIKYSYDDQVWSFYDIPSNGKAYLSNGVLLGEARCLDSEKIKIGQSITEFTIEEIHYKRDGTGKVQYKGIATFSWPHAAREATPEDLLTPPGYVRRISEQKISGSKDDDIFLYWPMGR